MMLAEKIKEIASEEAEYSRLNKYRPLRLIVGSIALTAFISIATAPPVKHENVRTMEYLRKELSQARADYSLSLDNIKRLEKVRYIDRLNSEITDILIANPDYNEIESNFYTNRRNHYIVLGGLGLLSISTLIPGVRGYVRKLKEERKKPTC